MLSYAHVKIVRRHSETAAEINTLTFRLTRASAEIDLCV